MADFEAKDITKEHTITADIFKKMVIAMKHWNSCSVTVLWNTMGHTQVLKWGKRKIPLKSEL